MAAAAASKLMLSSSLEAMTEVSTFSTLGSKILDFGFYFMFTNDSMNDKDLVEYWGEDLVCVNGRTGLLLLHPRCLMDVMRDFDGKWKGFGIPSRM